MAWPVNALHRSYSGSHLHHGVQKKYKYHPVWTKQMYDRQAADSAGFQNQCRVDAVLYIRFVKGRRYYYDWKTQLSRIKGKLHES